MTATVHRLPERAPQPRRDYAEASYFDGYHFAHIAAFYEHGRLQQIERKWRNFWGGRR